MYPMILIVVAVIAVTVMLWMVVPMFAKMFKDMDAELPGDHPVRRRRLGLHRRSTASMRVGASWRASSAFKRYIKTESGRRYVGGVLMVLPSVGQLMIEMAMYRFASNISLLLKSGVPMLETMHTLTGIFQNNPIYRDALRARRLAGSPRASRCTSRSRRPGCSCRCSPAWSRSARSRASSPQVMEQIAPFFKEKMEGMVLKVTKMLEPLIIMGMGIVDRRADAGDLHADVRDGGERQMSRDAIARARPTRRRRFASDPAIP